MDKIHVIEFKYGKPRQCGGEWMMIKHSMAPRSFDFITPEQAQDQQRLIDIHRVRFTDEGVNLSFVVIPNGLFLPVPISHYHQ